MNPFVSIALAFLGAFLTRVANMAWDDLWAKLYELIARAEEFYYSEEGQKRKQWVLDETMKWMEETLKPSPIQRFILKFAVGILIDALVKSINDTLGHDWVSKAREVEERLADILPVIE